MSEASRRGAPTITRISTVVEFFNTCHLDHPRCLKPPKDHSILPSRFVDVGDSDGTIEPKLVSSTNLTTIDKYTTLSHCWDVHPDHVPLRTTRITKAAHIVSIPMATLPKTFEMQLMSRVLSTSNISGSIRFVSLRMTWRNGKRKRQQWHRSTKAVA